MINRRDFNKLAGLSLLSLLLPGLPAGKENEMELSTLLEKMARGQRLNEGEIADLRFQARALDEVKNLAKGWVTQGTSTPIFQSPMETIYSVTTSQDLATITVPIPNKYRHLMLMTGGRNNLGTASVKYTLAQFNGDTTNNYYQMKTKNEGGTLDGEYNTNQPGALVGMTLDNGVAASQQAVSWVVIPHYLSEYTKQVIAVSSYNNGLFLTGSMWAEADPIESILFKPVSGSFLSGYALTILGIL